MLARRTIPTLLVALLMSASILGHDYVPGKPQTQPVLLRGGDLYTVSGPIMAATDLLFENGRITQIGKNLSAPGNAEIVDVTGMHVYPGLISAYNSLGLTEIGAVRATNDIAEIGSVTPEVATHIAYNPDSELLPSVRANGITTVQVVPGGSLLRGRSSIMNLDGWTKEDAAERINDGMHLTWPSVSISTAWWESRTPEKQREDMAEARERLRKLFEDARAYMMAKDTDPSVDQDLRWEAMVPVLKKEIPLFIFANDYRQISEAVQFAEEQKVNMVLNGGRDSWKLTDLLKDKNISVILGPTQDNPMRQDDLPNSPYQLPARLKKAGVTFCLSQGARRSSPSSWTARNLPFQAGTAVAHGLDKVTALRSITLSVAEILGLDNDLGSLEVGKKATLIISEGDIMDHLTHNVTHMWIEGRRVDLDNRHKELFRKYREKPTSTR